MQWKIVEKEMISWYRKKNCKRSMTNHKKMRCNFRGNKEKIIKALPITRRSNRKVKFSECEEHNNTRAAINNAGHW